MTRFRCAVIVAAVLRFHGVGLGADEPIKISTINDPSQPASAEMTKLFRQKIAEHAALFKLVGNDDASLGLVFQADCMPRQSTDAPYVCFYTLHYAGGTSKTLMGGGVDAAKTANDIADGFLSSIAQDIVEGSDNARRGNAVESLEACLFLTQSSCAVPEVLASELKVKTINLSQYLQKGGLMK
jgi:hypothetical protein